MCFSASVSFAVSAALLPIGAFTLHHAWHNDRRYLALAMFPLLFGAQQAIEGVLWLELATHDVAALRFSALGFLFFAYLFWPFFVPFAAKQIEKQPQRRSLFRWFALIGLGFGISLYLPLLMYPDWLVVSIHRHAILYEPVLIYDDIISRTAVRAFYAVLVSIPLLFSSATSLRRFGVLILASVVVSAVFFAYAFVSIWCFFAAALSLYTIVVLRDAKKQQSGRNVEMTNDPSMPRTR